MFTLRTTREFDASLRRCIRKGRDIEIFRETANILAEEGCLPPEYSPHKLTGIFSGYWECHMEDDWLLVWKQDDDKLILTMTNTGTHKELFSHRRKATIK